MPLATGSCLGPYEILALIGAGGMGEVYRARDPRLNREVAIKVSAGRFTDRFEREAQAIAALNHPHICQIYDVGPNYLVMELVHGTPLTGPLPPDQAIRLALQIASALEAAHAKGITHRDLKPGNILVSAAGVKLLDFGLAKIELPANAVDETVTATQVGTVLGTAAYMSPEQAAGKTADARSDIFSFGIVLYEMLSGQRAFPGESPITTLAAILHQDPRPLRDITPQVGGEIERVVARCLRKDPGRRFQTAADLKSALEEAAEAAPDEMPSIAVLPFANMSSSKDDEYFSDGLAEEILNLLAHIPGLKVTARTSSFALRDEKLDIRKIAETLGVRTILEGSVRRAGNRIRVTAQLIKAEDGYQLWSERYDRELTDVFAVQDEIAGAIAAALHLKLGGKRVSPPRHQPNLRAYEACLMGRYQLFKGRPDAYERARESLELAIALDPEYAEAHAELGQYYFLLGANGVRPPREVMPPARAQAAKALELSPGEPRAHAVLCSVAAVYDYDWKRAEEHFRMTLAADSVPPESRGRVALSYLLPLGRFGEAIALFEKVLEQDPLNVPFRGAYAWILSWTEMHGRALSEAEKARKMDDTHWLPLFAMGMSQVIRGDFAAAREPAERGGTIAGWNPLCRGLQAAILARLGDRAGVARLLETLAGMAPSGLFLYHLFCSDIGTAADWYARMIEERDPAAALFAASAFTKPLRSSPRWPALAKLMNLP